ncbi:hypothetical protein T484DRAFT_1826718 [Baffinella frigidus]|nr:hypothetical protein T484DRAFT_1826718 [Cryptophyta sp. CCMP2293]
MDSNLAVARSLREEGNMWFKQDNMELARESYESAIDSIECGMIASEESARDLSLCSDTASAEESDLVKALCLLNLAAVFLKNEAWLPAVEACSKEALEVVLVQFKRLRPAAG